MGKEGQTTGAWTQCIAEITDKDQQDLEVMTLLSPAITPEIIRPIRGFVDGIVLLTDSSGSFSAISFSRSRAVSFWVSRSDDSQLCQN
jgi:hypothetical protein